MIDDKVYFCSITMGVSFRDFREINTSLREQRAGFQYGPALDADGNPFWETDTGSLVIGIYRPRETFDNPNQAKFMLADAYRREAQARYQHPIFSPREPRIPEEYR